MQCPYLVEILRKDRRVVGEKATLRQIGSPAIPTLMATLDDPNPLLRQRACEVLSHIRPVEDTSVRRFLDCFRTVIATSTRQQLRAFATFRSRANKF
jgi:hypothetical protein